MEKLIAILGTLSENFIYHIDKFTELSALWKNTSGDNRNKATALLDNYLGNDGFSFWDAKPTHYEAVSALKARCKHGDTFDNSNYF